MTKILLDTSGYSKLLKGDKIIQSEVEEASVVYFSVVVVGELLAAFKNGSNETKNRQLLEKFTLKPSVVIVPITWETADIYAHLIHLLKKQGTPIPANDAWIAAHAIETGAKLITYDGHFLKIPGLRLWDKVTE